MSKRVRNRWFVRWGLLVVLLLIGAGVGLFFWQLNRVQQELANFVLAHPQDTAVITYTFDDNGNLVEDGSAIFHNADEPLVVASVMKTAVLAAYAQEVAEGRLDPNEPVVVAEWEQFYLPVTDGGAHKYGLQSLGLEVDELGFARDQTAVVTLDDLATIMMHFSGNASTDYLLERVGVEKVTAVLQTHLPNHSPINYTLAYALIAFNHEAPFSEAWLQQLQSNQLNELDRLVTLYRNDETWRAAQIDFLSNVTDFEIDAETAWDYQTAVSKFFPSGTAKEYAQMMAQIASGTFISEEVSAIMQNKLETVPSDWPLRATYFERFGAKDGVTAGVLAIASTGSPRWGDFKGQNRVVVLFVNDLPANQYGKLVQLQAHYLLPIDLAQGSGVSSQFFE